MLNGLHYPVYKEQCTLYTPEMYGLNYASACNWIRFWLQDPGLEEVAVPSPGYRQYWIKPSPGYT